MVGSIYNEWLDGYTMNGWMDIQWMVGWIYYEWLDGYTMNGWMDIQWMIRMNEIGEGNEIGL